LDVEQFLSTIHRYVQIGIYVKGYMSKELGRFQREIMEICEFYVDDDNQPKTNTIFQKTMDGKFTLNNPTNHLRDYLAIQGVILPDNIFRTADTTNQPNPTSSPNMTSSNTTITNNSNQVSGTSPINNVATNANQFNRVNSTDLPNASLPISNIETI
jgi:hypothetical protein